MSYTTVLQYNPFYHWLLLFRCFWRIMAYFKIPRLVELLFGQLFPSFGQRIELWVMKQSVVSVTPWKWSVAYTYVWVLLVIISVPVFQMFVFNEIRVNASNNDGRDAHEEEYPFPQLWVGFVWRFPRELLSASGGWTHITIPNIIQ